MRLLIVEDEARMAALLRRGFAGERLHVHIPPGACTIIESAR